MKRWIAPRTDEEMLREFPRRMREPHWFMRVREVSMNHFEILAQDRWGRQVTRSGSDPELDRLIEECEAYASSLSTRPEGA